MITEEMLKQERAQIIHVTQEDIRALADPVEAALKQDNICVIGNEDKIKKEQDLFEKTVSLF